MPPTQPQRLEVYLSGVGEPGSKSCGCNERDERRKGCELQAENLQEAEVACDLVDDADRRRTDTCKRISRENSGPRTATKCGTDREPSSCPGRPGCVRCRMGEISEGCHFLCQRSRTRLGLTARRVRATERKPAAVAGPPPIRS